MSKMTITLISCTAIIAVFILWRFTGGGERPATIWPSPKIQQEANYSFWAPFKENTGRFNAVLPAPPRHMSQTIRNNIDGMPRHYNIFVSQKLDSTLYLIQEIKIPDSIASRDVFSLAQSAVDDMLVSNPQNTLVSSEANDYKGLKSIKFSIENESDSIVGVSFVANKRLYVLAQVSKKNNKNIDEFDFFLDQFAIGSVNSQSLGERK